MARHSLVNQLLLIGLLLVLSSVIFQFGATGPINWSIVSLITAFIFSFGSIGLYQFSHIRLMTVFMMSLELIILLQFWLARAIDQAMVMTLAFWFTNELINIISHHKIIKYRLATTGLIFAVMFGMIIYTSPVGFEY